MNEAYRQYALTTFQRTDPDGCHDDAHATAECGRPHDKSHIVAILATTFSCQLACWLKPDQIAEINRRNKAQTDSGQNRLPPSPSRTYEGIAAAMAAQWT